MQTQDIKQTNQRIVSSAYLALPNTLKFNATDDAIDAHHAAAQLTS